ncbi:MAG TPA: hypothetical protein VMK65_00690 [Longimicrobiales bacterium]|nr:hypothetical protein [Longimicrobiales bacterium]
MIRSNRVALQAADEQTARLVELERRLAALEVVLGDVLLRLEEARAELQEEWPLVC